MGINRDSRHKKRLTGGRMPIHKKKRAFEKARPVSNTKLDLSTGKVDKRVRHVRVRGGNYKFRALRLKEGNFNWASEAVTKKARIINVVYNASNNELVRTNTLVKNCIVLIDATPFKSWYGNHYGVELGPGNFSIIQSRRTLRNKLRLNQRLRTRRDQSMSLLSLVEDKKIERLILRLRNNSDNKDFLLVLVPDQDSAEELMDIFLREKNLSSMPERLNKRESLDYQIFNTISLVLMEEGRILFWICSIFNIFILLIMFLNIGCSI